MASEWENHQEIYRVEWVKQLAQRPLTRQNESTNDVAPPSTSALPVTRPQASGSRKSSLSQPMLAPSTRSSRRLTSTSDSPRPPDNKRHKPNSSSSQTPVKSRSQASSLSTTTDEEQKLAPEWFQNRIHLSTSDSALVELLDRVGGASMRQKYDGMLRRWNDPADKARSAAVKGYDWEESNPTEDGPFWFQTLCDTVKGEVFDFKWVSRRKQGLENTDVITHPGRRRLDGLLVPKHLDHAQVGWPNIAAVTEFSKTFVPGRQGIRLDFPSKLVQLLFRLVALLAEQSTRLFVWGLGFSGSGDKAVLDLTVMDREVVRQARLSNCWSKENIRIVVALISTLASATPAELGYSPLVTYSSVLKPLRINLTGLPPFDTIGASNPPPPVLVLKESLFSRSYHVTPFSRGTAVFNAVEETDSSEPSSHYVIKLSWVSDDRAGREALALSRLAHLSNVPHLEYALSSSRLPSQYSHFPHIHPQRHLTIVVVTLPSPCRRLIDVPLSFTQILERFATLVGTLQQCEAANVRHRDISTGNLLVSSKEDGHQFVLNDFDCATILDAPLLPPSIATHARTGTLDTASIAVLEFGEVPGFSHIDVHDLESVVYAFWKVLARRLPHKFPADQFLFGAEAIDKSKSEIHVVRRQLWSTGAKTLGYTVVQALWKDDLGCVAKVLGGLRALQDLIVFESYGAEAGSVWDERTGKEVPSQPPSPPDYSKAVDALINVFTPLALSFEEQEKLDTVWKTQITPV